MALGVDCDNAFYTPAKDKSRQLPEDWLCVSPQCQCGLPKLENLLQSSRKTVHAMPASAPSVAALASSVALAPSVVSPATVPSDDPARPAEWEHPESSHDEDEVDDEASVLGGPAQIPASHKYCRFCP